MKITSENRYQKFYNRLFVISPWIVFAGLLQFHFQQFIPFNRIFRGVYFFDYVTIMDFFVVFLVFVFLIGRARGWIQFNKNRVPWPLKTVILLLLIAGLLQVLFQQVYEPVLTTTTEYFRSLFLFPLIFLVLAYRTIENGVIGLILKSYVLLVAVFCLLALLQYFTGIFPGARHDFMGRLVWPYVDFVTLEAASANWVAFFVTPALLLSFTNLLPTYRRLKHQDCDSSLKICPIMKDLKLYVVAFFLSGIVIYLTQSYGAYVALFAGISFYLFRSLSLKKFLASLLVLALIGGGIFFLQTKTLKYRVNYGNAEYKYSTSVASRADIYKMNVSMILKNPLLGVGLNQYQSYFALNHKQILGHEYGEVHIPPHAHNFFVSFWTSLGIFGFLAMVILLIDVLWRNKLKTTHPAVFVFIAIMIHGLIDSYYWKQEIAYIFWFVVLFSYLYEVQNSKSASVALS